MPIIIEGGCLSKYEDFTNSIKVFNKYTFSSKFIRSMHPSECDGRISIEPCHIYTTAMEPDPSTNIIINF
jgi:hypothetical protein